MKRKQEFKITVPKPCNASWVSMSESSVGRYCSNCEKEVIDFRNYSHDDLQAWFSESKTKICGHFNTNQLDLITNQSLMPKASVYFKAKMLIASCIAFCTMLKTSAAERMTKHISSTYLQPKQFKEILPDKYQKPLKDSLITIRGVVTDAEKMPLPGVSIVVKDSNISGVTNVKGQFSLKIPLINEMTSVVLAIRYIGYDHQEQKVDLKKSSEISVVMSEWHGTLGGVIVKRRGFFYKITHPFKR